MTLNIALLGTGRIAEYGYIPAIDKIDDVSIISVLSRSEAKGSEFAIKHSIPKAYVEIDDLLEDKFSLPTALRRSRSYSLVVLESIFYVKSQCQQTLKAVKI